MIVFLTFFFLLFINIPRKILLFIKLIIGLYPGLTGPIVVYIIGEVVFHISSFIIPVLTALNSSQDWLYTCLQADLINQIPACSLDNASVITSRSRL